MTESGSRGRSHRELNMLRATGLKMEEGSVRHGSGRRWRQEVEEGKEMDSPLESSEGIQL